MHSAAAGRMLAFKEVMFSNWQQVALWFSRDSLNCPINHRNRTISKQNKSGTSGVRLDKSNGTPGWTASWYDDEKRHGKFFSIKKYGNEEAKQLAINYRKERAQENGYINV